MKDKDSSWEEREREGKERIDQYKSWGENKHEKKRGEGGGGNKKVEGGKK